MSSDPIISVENLSKRYMIGHQRSRKDGFRHAIEEAVRAPYRWLRSPNRPKKSKKEEFWALRDVSFTVRRGEVLGVIGQNGAGKSTLLKILSRITEPTTGRICLRGRVSSLLEVGTGFHQELTGRENIFLNGAILGMKKAEIRRKFDEIVAFSEVEQFLDTPVKRYSSGMYVRLAFAVAAHLEPEILIVDEVLAVGDASFQRKCLGKISQVSQQGRTILFVSHNMGAIAALTTRCVLLDSGRVSLNGTPRDVIAAYIALGYQERASWEAPEINSNPIQILSIRVSSPNMHDPGGNEFDVGSDIVIEITHVVRSPVSNSVLAINVHALDGAHLISLEDIDNNPDLLLKRHPGTYCSTVTLPGNWLNSGTFLVRVGCGIVGMTSWDNIERISFRLVETGDPLTRGHRKGYLLPMLRWDVQSVESCPR